MPKYWKVLAIVGILALSLVGGYFLGAGNTSHTDAERLTQALDTTAALRTDNEKLREQLSTISSQLDDSRAEASRLGSLLSDAIKAVGSVAESITSAQGNASDLDTINRDFRSFLEDLRQRGSK